MLRAFSTACFLLAAASLAGCGPDPAPAAPAAPAPAPGGPVDDAPAKGDWLIARLPVEMPHLNPITSSDAYATRVMGHIFESLLERDPDTLEMVPWIAERWETSPDKLQYTFHLRKDAKFSDGTPITAHDCKFTYDVLMNPATDAAPLRNYLQDVIACDVVDDYTVRYTCKQPYFLHLLFMGGLDILPRRLYAQGDFNTAHGRTPVGSGPYVLESWKTGAEIVLARNAQYWNAAQRPGWFDKIVFRIIANDEAALNVLTKGEIDTMGLLPEQWVERTDSPRFNERFEKTSFSAPQFNYIGWNTRRPQFADKRVRRALTMLLDRESIKKSLYYDLADITAAGIFPALPEHNPNLVPLPFDPAGAAQLLDEAGWKDSNGDGLRDRDGAALRFETLITDNNPMAEKILTLFQEELERAGIQLDIRVAEWAGLVERIDKREFDSVMMGWQMTPDPDMYQIWHSSQAEKGSNYVGFVNAEADALIEKSRLEFDRTVRAGYLQRVQEILHDEQPYTFLFVPRSLVAIDKRIHNAKLYPLLQSRPRWEWFVPAQLQRYR